MALIGGYRISAHAKKQKLKIFIRIVRTNVNFSGLKQTEDNSHAKKLYSILVTVRES